MLQRWTYGKVEPPPPTEFFVVRHAAIALLGLDRLIVDISLGMRYVKLDWVDRDGHRMVEVLQRAGEPNRAEVKWK